MSLSSCCCHDPITKYIESEVLELIACTVRGTLPEKWRGITATNLATSLAVHCIIHELHAQAATCTLRDVYYRVSPHVAVSQNHTNAIVGKLAAELEVPRAALRIFASSRGYIAGRVTVRGISCACPCGVGVPGDLTSGEVVPDPTARYVIIIEKDCVFQAISRSLLWQRLPCILLTGCGFPDVATRVAARCLEDEGLKCFGLVDYNPAGVRILTTYRGNTARSSRATSAREVVNVAVRSLTWLGVHARDVKDGGARTVPLTTRDRQLKEGLLSDETVPQEWRDEVRNMTFKAEIQALYDTTQPSASSPTSCVLANYIEKQVLHGRAL
eukprot:PhM_4_TR2295/c0_g1_i1/m.70124/K10878/SPO11; meiotic recombination protein SPO11